MRLKIRTPQCEPLATGLGMEMKSSILGVPQSCDYKHNILSMTIQLQGVTYSETFKLINFNILMRLSYCPK